MGNEALLAASQQPKEDYTSGGKQQQQALIGSSNILSGGIYELNHVLSKVVFEANSTSSQKSSSQ